ncbi:MAG: hypothetical protein STHCBS139747_002940 [Sporothrix thermara]
MDTEEVLPLLEPPGEFEANAYYWSFPSRPRLIGRTSAGTTPWWRLSEKPADYSVFWGEYSGLDTATMCGPVGRHRIHACWQAKTLNRVCAALEGLSWTSIDVMRIGRTELQECQRPIIVWVGVSATALAKLSAPWPLIASKLRAVRLALDADGLTDVECEMRKSELILTVDDASPRLLEPRRGADRQGSSSSELLATLAVSTAVGQAISPAHYQSSTGTLGLYLATKNEPGKKRQDDAAVWALTCHHVVFPAGGQRTTPPAVMMLPTTAVLDDALSTINMEISEARDSIAGARPRNAQTPDETLTWQVAQRRLHRGTQLLRVLSSFQASDEARVLGHVHHSPPRGVNNAKGEPAYTRDWALIALDRAKFPAAYRLENVVDLEMETSRKLHKLINTHIRSVAGAPKPVYNFPPDKLIRLQGIVPVSEMLGRPPAHNLLATHDGDPHLIVMKRGYTSEVTAGVVLDIQSVTRHFSGSREVRSHELTVMHISGQRAIGDSTVNNFSGPGDSGAIVFDLKGRIVGMLTGGSGGHGQIDTTYVTPFKYLQDDIERALKRPIRLP